MEDLNPEGVWCKALEYYELRRKIKFIRYPRSRKSGSETKE
jgi:hypothetical protein